jgi:putative membrane protein
VKRDASATSETLAGTADGTTRTLDREPPQDFDKEYVDSQVHEHQTVLDTIDQKLLDSAQDANVRAYVVDVRAAVASHLQHAQYLQKGMQP